MNGQALRVIPAPAEPNECPAITRSTAATTPAAAAESLPDPGFLVPASRAARPSGWRSALQRGFHEAARLTRADVGLLHLCGDAYLFTVAVHGLDPTLHMLVAVSFWDDAMQHVLRGGTISGSNGDSMQAGNVARRVQSARVPRYVLSAPLLMDGQVEAVIELGRHDAAFGGSDPLVCTRALRNALQAQGLASGWKLPGMAGSAA